MINLEETIVRKLKTTQHILCTVESCTGGLIAHLITNVSGASEVYWGSQIVYDNSAKEALGVSASLLKNFGAVSAEVAKSLAECGLIHLKNTLDQQKYNSLVQPKGLICISTTGIAGPLGGSLEKKVGLCYIALARTGEKTLLHPIQIDQQKSRIEMKTEFAYQALNLIRGIF